MGLDFTYGMGNDEECIRYLENIEIIEYNMDKIMGYWYNENEEKILEYKHLIMLDLETKGLKKLSKRDDFVEKFEAKITELNEKETFQSAMTYEQDQKLILNTEKRISFNEGKEERNVEIAKLMLTKDIDKQTISDCTGLSIKDLENLNSE